MSRHTGLQAFGSGRALRVGGCWPAEDERCVDFPVAFRRRRSFPACFVAVLGHGGGASFVTAGAPVHLQHPCLCELRVSFSAAQFGEK